MVLEARRPFHVPGTYPCTRNGDRIAMRPPCPLITGRYRPASPRAGAGGTTPRVPIRRWLARIRQVVQRAATSSGQPPPGSHYNSRSSRGPPPSSGGTSEPRDRGFAVAVSRRRGGFGGPTRMAAGRRPEQGRLGAGPSAPMRSRWASKAWITWKASSSDTWRPSRSTAPRTTATASSSPITTSSGGVDVVTGQGRQALALQVVERGKDQLAHLVVGEAGLHLLRQGVAHLPQRLVHVEDRRPASRAPAETPPTPRTPPRSRRRATRRGR